MLSAGKGLKSSGLIIIPFSKAALIPAMCTENS